MTNFEKATAIVVDSIKHDASVCGVDWNRVSNWNELLDWIGQDSADMKEDIRFELCRAANMGNFPFCFMDDMSIEDSDGSVKTYRQLINAVRKQLFA